jgi:hypothetical protein
MTNSVICASLTVQHNNFYAVISWRCVYIILCLTRIPRSNEQRCQNTRGDYRAFGSQTISTWGMCPVVNGSVQTWTFSFAKQNGVLFFPTPYEELYLICSDSVTQTERRQAYDMCEYIKACKQAHIWGNIRHSLVIRILAVTCIYFICKYLH